MKQYTTKEQSDKLRELGYPQPKNITNNYSIGELIEFITTNKELNICKWEGSNNWCIDCDMIRRGVNIVLIDALYDTCIMAKLNKL